uniref:Uncharacterized protein n=1 Tax=Arundo donax TaxID=35708 RepID=A0A0A8Y4A7_ARUDO
MGSTAAPSASSLAPTLAPISFGALVLDIKLHGQNYREGNGPFPSKFCFRLLVLIHT